MGAKPSDTACCNMMAYLLRKSLEKYELEPDGPVNVFRKDEAEEHWESVQHLCQLFGCTAEELLGKTEKQVTA
jgi:hypothetical protein